MTQPSFTEFPKIAALSGITDFEFIKSVESSVTTHWGVAWSEDMIARDLWQNFRDGNKDDLDGLKFTKNKTGSDVSIWGQATFNLQRLVYLGSEKTDDDDIGRFGEGFKAAVVGLLRDFNVTPVMISGTTMIRIRIADKAIEGTELRPLVYDFYSCNDNPGSRLILLGCSKPLSNAMKQGIEHFFWPTHPMLGKLINSDKTMSVYESKTKNGYGFYRGLKRCEIDGIGLIFVLHTKVATLEKLVGQDRDRNQFNESIREAFFKVCFKGARGEKYAGLILSKTKHLWENGHGHHLISACASSITYIPNYINLRNTDFLQYEARSIGNLTTWKNRGTFNNYYDEHFKDESRYICNLSEGEYSNKEMVSIFSECKAKGALPMPRYFMKFGVRTSRFLDELRRGNEVESLKTTSEFKPTPLEEIALGICNKAINSTNGLVQMIARLGDFAVLVGEDESMLGQFRNYGTMKNGSSIFMNSRLFVSTFGAAFSTYVHELSHIHGHDGSRDFTDALTDVISCMLDNHGLYAHYIAEWNKISECIFYTRSGLKLSLSHELYLKTSYELIDILLELKIDVVINAAIQYVSCLPQNESTRDQLDMYQTTLSSIRGMSDQEKITEYRNNFGVLFGINDKKDFEGILKMVGIDKLNGILKPFDVTGPTQTST